MSATTEAIQVGLNSRGFEFDYGNDTEALRHGKTQNCRRARLARTGATADSGQQYARGRYFLRDTSLYGESKQPFKLTETVWQLDVRLP